MRIATTVCALAAVSMSAAAHAQEYPTKLIRMVVPGLPGGSADIIARMIGARLSERYGQPVVTENRSGAGQMIGFDYLAKAPPDGHVLLLGTITYTTTVATRASLPFDPANDITGVTMIGQGPLLLVVHPSLPVKSVKELIALARSRPHTINYASSGTGTIVHLVAEDFASRAKIDIVHVPYKSIAPAVTDVVGGHVPMMFASLPAAWHHVKSNRLRALGVTTAKRSQFMPGLPTIAEAGVPGFEASTWWGLFAQGRTPKETVAKINAEIQKIVVADDIKTRLNAEGAQPVSGMTSDAFNALLRQEIASWRAIAKERKIQGEM
ncbi:MAG TPA: tripartite tricarboxylate transporter substrate binding protein [Burkholderiales bacterium]|nr:tripartite tricarboxylate transporter substrate binding protein [Burkholderiales bacterium]